MNGTTMRNKRDHYDILGVKRNAEAAELKSVYRKLSKKYHPDVNPGNPEAEAKMREINEAYTVLSDPEKRAEYDRFGHETSAHDGTRKGSGPFSGGFDGNSDITFDDLFGSGFANYAKRKNKKYEPGRGRDVSVNMHIGYYESITGVEKEITISFSEKCGFCGEAGSAAGPAATRCGRCDGTGKERVTVKSGFGKMVQTRPCSLCNGTGKDKEACAECFGKGYVKTIKKIKVRVPKGIISGQSVTIDGMGEPGERGGSRGDLVIKVSVR